jgi:Domain of unknown function (DUF4351)
MPSQLHEAWLLLFRNRPQLAAELLRDALHFELPRYTEARIESAELTDVHPAEYRADLVVLLLDEVPVLGIIVEVQLSRDGRKRFVWPVYVTSLRARLKCPVCLLVVTADDAVARWAAKPVDIGGGNRFVPLVMGPSGVPEVIDEVQARADPELAVLSAMAHGRDADSAKSARIARVAQIASHDLDEDRAWLYLDLAVSCLSEAARRAFQSMDIRKYEFQSEFAKRYVAEGRARGLAEGKAEGKAEGELQGRAALVVRLLSLRFGPMSEDVRAKIGAASIGELDAIGERLLTVSTLQAALGPLIGNQVDPDRVA